MQVRILIEIRQPTGSAKLVHAPDLHDVETVGQLLAAIEKSKMDAIAELPKWLPLAEKSLNAPR